MRKRDGNQRITGGNKENARQLGQAGSVLLVELREPQYHLLLWPVIQQHTPFFENSGLRICDLFTPNCKEQPRLAKIAKV